MAPDTGDILYVSVVPEHKEVAPLIEPGCTGIVEPDMSNERGLLIPQLLRAATDTVPPSDPGMASMDEEVELPLHPDGNVQA